MTRQNVFGFASNSALFAAAVLVNSPNYSQPATWYSAESQHASAASVLRNTVSNADVLQQES
jgi:hypothetical protein